jgi:hypothetical protein
MAAHPINFELLPGATHWFESGDRLLDDLGELSAFIRDQAQLKRPKAKKL